MEGHAVHDDAFYVPREMLERWAERDPIERYRAGCSDHADLSEDEESEIQSQVKRHLNDALERAEDSPPPDPADLLTACTPSLKSSSSPTTCSEQMAEKTYLQAISDGLRQEMRHDRARLPDRRGHRRLRRRVQGHGRLPGGVRLRGG